MQMVELGSKIEAISWMFGVPITLLQNHLYGITQSKIKKQGQNVAKKGKGICAICETMKVIKHSITHTIKTKSCQDYTCERQTPSKNGIPRGGWFKWFKEHNPNLLVKVAHGLEVGHMKGLCPTNVESFYTNLTQEYNLHNYMPKCIWNCNESNAPIGWNCEALVLAKTNSRFVHSTTLDERK